MVARYNPQLSRELAEKADAVNASDAGSEAACVDFERYHSAARMLQLSAEVELLRSVVEQARRIRYSPDVGYTDVRHVFEAVRLLGSAA